MKNIKHGKSGISIQTSLSLMFRKKEERKQSWITSEILEMKED